MLQYLSLPHISQPLLNNASHACIEKNTLMIKGRNVVSCCILSNSACTVSATMAASSNWVEKEGGKKLIFCLHCWHSVPLHFYSFFLLFVNLFPPLHQLFKAYTSHSLTQCYCVGGCLACFLDCLHVILMLNGYRLFQWPVMATGSCCHEHCSFHVSSFFRVSFQTQSCLFTHLV